jgi:hypothetical protein
VRSSEYAALMALDMTEAPDMVEALPIVVEVGG